jgi:predicted component of type VI protein secretion system
MDNEEPTLEAEPAWWIEWEGGGHHHRRVLTDTVSVGRSRTMDVVLDDPFVSRSHCVITLTASGPVVDASKSLHQVVVAGIDVERAPLHHGDTVTVGETTLVIRFGRSDAAETLIRRRHPTTCSLRSSTRELFDPSGKLVAAFSVDEARFLEVLVRRYPDAASHEELGGAVWGGTGYDPYLIHRLAQRVRLRLDERSHLVVNVRGAGYRLAEAVAVR